jgi:hypothetical protein
LYKTAYLQVDAVAADATIADATTDDVVLTGCSFALRFVVVALTL